MKVSFAGRFVLAVAGVLMAGVAVAQGPGPGRVGPGFGDHQPPFEQAFRFHGMDGRWWNNPMIVQRLKLTDDQRKAMDGILYDHRERLIDLQANLEKAELAMQPLMSADQPNEAEIDAQIDKVVQARADLERANSRFLLAIRMKLTPDQWKEVKAFRDERDMHGMARHGWGPGDRRRDIQGQGRRMRPQSPPPPPPPQAAPSTTPAPGDGGGADQ